MIGGENQANGDHPLSNGGQPLSGDPPLSLPPPNHHPLSHPLEFPTIATSSPSAADDEFDPSDLLSPNSDSPTSFHDINHTNTNALDQAESSPDPSDYIRISVSNPQKVPEASNSIVPGRNSYYTYRVTTTTNVAEFGGSEFRVRRRFRDVVALSDRLSERYRGFFVPLRPDKGVIEGQVMEKTEFVEQRRAAIEKYLRKLAAHPVIRKGKELRDFLAAEDGDFSAASSSTQFSDEAGAAVAGSPRQAVGKGGGRDWWRMFKEVKQSVVNEWGGSRPPVTEEDKEFLERKKRLEEIGGQLTGVTQQAEGLVTAQQELGQTMGELGLMFMKLVKFENQEAVLESQRRRAADMKNVATATIKTSRLYRSLNDKTASHLDVLHDYLGMMLAADHAFAERSSALLNVQTLASELSSLQFKIEKLEISSSKIFGGDRSTLLKIEEMKETAKTTEEAKHSAIVAYDQIKENNKAELHRLDKDRRSDFWNMIKGFVVCQAEYAESMASVWENLAEDTSGYTDIIP
ncbi:hypothetical protein V2J09_024139 [Rumex salicifolius]